jgi:MSHA biogenesis protein MshI
VRKLGNWLKQIGVKPGTVGLELHEHGFSIAVRDIPAPGLQRVFHHDSRLEAGEKVSLSRALEAAVGKFQLSGRRCNVVLPCGTYQLLLVEAPDVPDEELSDALRWKVKDLSSTPVEEAAIDVFRLPKDANRNGKAMVYVVISPLKSIVEIADAVKDSGLELNAIDIEELSLGNLVELKQDERGVAMVHLREGSGMLAIFRAGNLYLSRQFRLDYNGGLLDDLPGESLSLEVQRSLDYFERQMGQAAPAKLYICGVGIGEEKITEDLKKHFSLPVELYEFSSLAGDDVNEGVAQMSASAIAVSYRSGAVA